MTDLNLNAEEILDSALETAKGLIMEKPLHAEVVLQQVLRAFPDQPTALQLLGIVKQKLQDFEESIRLITKAIELEPDCADNYNNMALSYANLDQYETSIEFLNKALEIKPDNHLYINNLALQYRQIGRHDIALKLFERALAIKNQPEVWCNCGGVYGEIKDLKNAERCFLTALELNPDFPAAHVDLAFTRHLLGDWQGGFEHYEWRFEHFHQLKFYKQAYDQTKRWRGEDLQGKRILLYGEQGLGDMIQFIRYVPYLKELGAYTIVHCADILESVLGRCPGVDEVVVRDIVSNKGPEFPPYDYQCSLMSLPNLLKLGGIPRGVYIQPKATLDIRKSYPETFNIGISWAGSAAHPNDAARSLELKWFYPITQIPGVRLFNLQVNRDKRVYVQGKRIVDYTDGGENVRMVDMTPLIKNFEDSATIISGLDLVISVDTALVHLAGAMGVPCWVLISYNPDWRWQITGSRSAWYDSLELFRQPTPRDWESVFQEMRVRLEQRADHLSN